LTHCDLDLRILPKLMIKLDHCAKFPRQRSLVQWSFGSKINIREVENRRDDAKNKGLPVNNVSLARQILERCISDITSWCASRRLQPYIGKIPASVIPNILPVLFTARPDRLHAIALSRISCLSFDYCSVLSCDLVV